MSDELCYTLTMSSKNKNQTKPKKSSITSAPVTIEKKSVKSSPNTINEPFLASLKKTTNTPSRTINPVWAWIAGIAFLVLIAALIIVKNFVLAASVNGQIISRLSIIKELEKREGKALLDQKVTEALINQEAKKQNLVITQEEIDAEVNKIADNLKQRSQDLDQALQAQGMTKADLNNQLKTQLIVQKLASAEASVSDQDIETYMKDNKDTLPKGAKPEEIKDSIKQMLGQQKQRDAVQAWLTDLKAKANINYFINY
jgi:parvulin-like peptidyl-prolyl isomerase